MRRCVLICLMLLLPVQWTWAAAAAYCMHESGRAAQHLGHHEHKHQKSDASGKVNSKALADNDCGVCHLSGLQWLDLGSTQLVQAESSPPRFDVGVVFRSHIPSAPERPDRPRIA